MLLCSLFGLKTVGCGKSAMIGGSEKARMKCYALIDWARKDRKSCCPPVGLRSDNAL